MRTQNMIPGRGCLAVIVACVAGGYIGFCGFIVLSVDAAWKGILQPGYEVQWGIFAGIFYACVAGAVGGVIGISRFRIYLFWLGFGTLLLWLCWCVFQLVIYWPLMDVRPYNFGVRVVGVVILTGAALAGALGVAIAKHMTSSPRLQFNLKTLLLLVTMCSVWFGLFAIWGQLRGQWLEQKLAADRDEKLQILAKLQHFQCFAEWGKSGYDETRMVRLHLVAIPPLQDAELRDDLCHLNELVWVGLQTLDLRETEVTDAGLEHLKVLAKLKYLNLEGTQVSDDAVEKLQQALPRCKIEH